MSELTQPEGVAHAPRGVEATQPKPTSRLAQATPKEKDGMAENGGTVPELPAGMPTPPPELSWEELKKIPPWNRLLENMETPQGGAAKPKLNIPEFVPRAKAPSTPKEAPGAAKGGEAVPGGSPDARSMSNGGYAPR